MQVLDYDRFSRDDPIGEICLPLNDLDLTTGQTMWRALQPCKGHMVCIIADLCLYSGKTYTFITQVFHKYGSKAASGAATPRISYTKTNFKIITQACQSWLRLNMDYVILQYVYSVFST